MASCNPESKDGPIWLSEWKTNERVGWLAGVLQLKRRNKNVSLSEYLGWTEGTIDNQCRWWFSNGSQGTDHVRRGQVKRKGR